LGLVDVRDVAEAHFRAGFTPEAQGRYITSAHNTDMLEIGKSLLSRYGKSFPLPKGAVPKFVLMLIGPLANKLVTRRFVRNNVNVPWKADNSKIRKELKMTFRPMQQTMEDAFQVLIDEGVLVAK
jgi:nucleoside-diphosphate-sugar epimerase